MRHDRRQYAGNTADAALVKDSSLNIKSLAGCAGCTQISRPTSADTDLDNDTANFSRLPAIPVVKPWQLEWEVMCATAVAQVTLAMGRLQQSDGLNPERIRDCQGELIGPLDDSNEMTMSNSAAALGFEDSCGSTISHVDFVQEQAAMAFRVGPMRTAAGMKQPVHDYLLDILAGCERSYNNAVQLPLNPKAPKFINDFMKSIKTDKQAKYVITHTLRSFSTLALAPGTMKNRLSAISNWIPVLIEVYHTSPWRVILGLWDQLNYSQRRREEDYWLGFLAVQTKRCSRFQSVNNMISGVRQFFLEQLDIPVPQLSDIFPRFTNKKRLAKKLDKKRQGRRARRPAIKWSQLVKACIHLIMLSKQEDQNIGHRLHFLILRSICCFCFVLLFRTGELAKGADFDPNRNWTEAWLRPLTKCKPGHSVLVFQPARKVETEITEEQLPIVFLDHPANPVKAYTDLTKFRSEHGFEISASSDAFLLHDGSSPSQNWVAKRLKRLMSIVLEPRFAATLDYSTHCLRRGGDNALNILNVPTTVANHYGGRTEGSRSRDVYLQRVLGQIGRIQRDMHTLGEYEFLQDDFEWANRIDRNPSLNPLPNPAVEEGPEYDTTDDEDDDDAMGDDDVDDDDDADHTAPARSSETVQGVIARRAVATAAAAFAEAAPEIGAELPPDYAADDAPAQQSVRPAANFSPTVDVLDAPPTGQTPAATVSQPRSRPRKVRKLAPPVKKPGPKTAAYKAHAEAYEAQENDRAASVRQKNASYWRRMFPQKK